MEEVEQGTADDINNSEDNMIAENNVILDTPQKPTKYFEYETPATSNQELS
jgi:hypothetical protein